MTLTQLEYILAVHTHKHFGKAAESCFVTQPTLSAQIQKLESELELQIFDRTRTPIATTPDGQRIVEQAKKVLQEQKILSQMAKLSHVQIAGDFRLAVIPTLSPFLIPLFAMKYVNKYPQLSLHISENTTEEIIQLLKDDEIDAALLVTPLYEKTIVEEPLYYEPFYLFVSPTHELANKQTIREEDLNIHDIWLLNKGHCFRDQVLNICSKTKERPIQGPINFESGNLETLKNMVLKGMGYTILPQMAVSQLSASQKKLVRPFNRPVPTREVSLVYKKNNFKQHIIDSLREEITKIVPENLRKASKKENQIIDIT